MNLAPVSFEQQCAAASARLGVLPWLKVLSPLALVAAAFAIPGLDLRTRGALVSSMALVATFLVLEMLRRHGALRRALQSPTGVAHWFVAPAPWYGRRPRLVYVDEDGVFVEHVGWFAFASSMRPGLRSLSFDERRYQLQVQTHEWGRGGTDRYRTWRVEVPREVSVPQATQLAVEANRRIARHG